MWIFVRADCTGEKVHSSFLFTAFGVGVREYPFFRRERLPHQGNPGQVISEPREVANGNFDRLHCLEHSDIKLSCSPNRGEVSSR